MVLKEYARSTNTGMERDSICIAKAETKNKTKKPVKQYDFIFIKNRHYDYIS